MSCQCYQIGGPFIAEDPDCPIHGRDRDVRNKAADKLLDESEETDDVAQLKRIIDDMHSLIMDIW